MLNTNDIERLNNVKYEYLYGTVQKKNYIIHTFQILIRIWEKHKEDTSCAGLPVQLYWTFLMYTFILSGRK